ncbi:hypothetical protein EVAR_4465_1 [Eumeta japonica]|uniref:Uncharacterized protein n=1 Tax=Eumeta variegata TaxID=151549 RepID=A0A4C1SXX3_EUMVA|nr:hypothetical protein EVAR_4465_1 [Eumeta japonica]
MATLGSKYIETRISGTWITTELDLLGALSLHNTSRAGVSAAPGITPQRLAFTLQGRPFCVSRLGDGLRWNVEVVVVRPQDGWVSASYCPARAVSSCDTSVPAQ